jgi:putative sensory box sensor/GGDEF/EAL domain protein
MINERKQDINNTSSITDYLGNWLWNSLDFENTSVDIDKMLGYLGELCKSERSYVFEIDFSNETMSNTYEWCAKGVATQKDMLQNESIQVVDFWLDLFKENKNVIIHDIEAIKVDNPSTYAILKPQNIKSLMVVPIRLGDEIAGFLGVDNPENMTEDEIIPLLKKISSLFSFIVKHKSLEKKVAFDKYHDLLTLAYNRDAFEEDFKEAEARRQLGIVTCDLIELENINDEYGYQEGDIVICRCHTVLKEIFSGYKIYRVTGKHFVILCPDIDSAYFDKLMKMLEGEINDKTLPMVFGSYWSNENPLIPAEIRAVAESVLYKNKAIYFSRPDSVSGRTRNRRMLGVDNFIDNFNDSRNSMLYRFIENNYFSLDIFFKTLELGDNYAYFGDLQKNVWYLSDTLKEKWGFENNIVYNLPQEWKKFITHKEDLDFYEKDFDEFIKLRREVYDLIYRVVNKDGEEVWVHCAGYIKWDKDKEKPLFYSGQVSILNNAFDTCPITNFQKEKAAVRDISTLFYNGNTSYCLCFRLNGFGEINELRGRAIGDNLIKDIGAELFQSFDDEIKFYRLDGLRFMAIISERAKYELSEYSKRIKKVISDSYAEYNLPIRYPCSVGIFGELNPEMSAIEIMTDVMSVLDIAKHKPEEDIIYTEQTMSSHREQKQMLLEISKDVANDMNNFRVVMQPIVSADSHRLIGGELLLRWSYQGQNISPITFVPILEENNLMPTVGKWVFKQAAKLCKRINAYIPEFTLDFNVSYYQIKDETLLPYMKQLLDDYGMDGSRLVLELTETHYHDDPIKLTKFIESCKDMNMRMAIDDFGVGYSSLEMLLKYPANIVKLDRSLMKKMSDSSDSKLFISTLVSACHNFDKMVCVEGVETEKELHIVTEAGCDSVQGYYFYRPMEIPDVYKLFATI